jgi:hypothetical protein
MLKSLMIQLHGIYLCCGEIDIQTGLKRLHIIKMEFGEMYLSASWKLKHSKSIVALSIKSGYL